MDQWKQYGIMMVMRNNHYGNGYDQEKIGCDMLLVLMVLLALLVCRILSLHKKHQKYNSKKQ